VAADDDLGPTLIAFRPTILMPLVWAGALAAFIVFVAVEEHGPGNANLLLGRHTFPTFVGTVGAAVLILYYARSFAFCRRGIRVKTLFGTRKIPVERIVTHSWDAMASWTGAASVKKNFWVRGGLPVFFWGEVNRSMQKLDEAEFELSKSMAARLEKRIRLEGVVKVGSRWFLSGTGVRTGRDPRTETAYAKLSHCNLDNGRFVLFAHGKRRPIVKTTSWQYGFSPALCCLLRFWKPRESTPLPNE
jgi:hypothetical protein